MKRWRFIFTDANDAFFNMALHYSPLPIGERDRVRGLCIRNKCLWICYLADKATVK